MHSISNDSVNETAPENHDETLDQVDHWTLTSKQTPSIGDIIFVNSLIHVDNMYKNHLIIIVTAFVVVFGIVKLCYSWRFCYLEYVPEPIAILAIGLAFGGAVYHFHMQLHYFNKQTFFVIFLPPIIFEAVLQMHKQYFMRHLKVILMFGFFGTLLNFLMLGCSLWLLNTTPLFGSEGLSFRPVAFFLFAALVSSVDSVIIIGILGEMQVHPSLYFIFLGESVINDGVTLAIFDYIYSISCKMPSPSTESSFALIVMGMFIMSIKIIGSCTMGAVFGSMTCFLTKYTYKFTMIEPLIVLSSGYLTYLFDFGISWPGVFALLVFGLIQTSYTFQNISAKSRITIKRFAHMTAAVSESLIFLMIGYTLIVEQQVWHTSFILSSLVLCTVGRFVVIYVLASLANWMQWLAKPITATMKFVIGFCGLRGAISHSLAEIVDSKCLGSIGVKPGMLQTTAVFITFSAIIIIGTLLRPLLRLFQMRSEKQPTSLFATLNEEVMHKMMNCLEEIAGLTEVNSLLFRLKKWDQRYVRPILLRDSTPQDQIVEVFGRITIALHYASLATHGASAHQHLSKLHPNHRVTPATAPPITCNERLYDPGQNEDCAPANLTVGTLLHGTSMWKADSTMTRLNTILSQPQNMPPTIRTRRVGRCSCWRQCRRKNRGRPFRLVHDKSRGLGNVAQQEHDRQRDRRQSQHEQQHKQQQLDKLEQQATPPPSAVAALLQEKKHEEDERQINPESLSNVKQRMCPVQQSASSLQDVSSSFATCTSLSTTHSADQLPGCSKFIRMMKPQSSKPEPSEKHKEVSRILIDKRYQGGVEHLSYLDRMRYAIQLKQSVIQIQQHTLNPRVSLFRRLYTVRSLDRLFSGMASTFSLDRITRPFHVRQQPPPVPQQPPRLPPCLITAPPDESAPTQPVHPNELDKTDQFPV